MLSHLPTILPKPNQIAPTWNQLPNLPASETDSIESDQSQQQIISMATPVDSNLQFLEQYESIGKIVNPRTEEHQAQFVSKVASSSKLLQLLLNQPVPMATGDKPRHEPPEHQPVPTILTPTSGVVLSRHQSVPIATHVNPSANSHQLAETLTWHMTDAHDVRESCKEDPSENESDILQFIQAESDKQSKISDESCVHRLDEIGKFKEKSNEAGSCKENRMLESCANELNVVESDVEQSVSVNSSKQELLEIRSSKRQPKWSESDTTELDMRDICDVEHQIHKRDENQDTGVGLASGKSILQNKMPFDLSEQSYVGNRN